MGREIKIALSKLVKQGKIIEIEICEVKNRYVVNSSDLDMLRRLEKENSSKKVSFLSPLDNLLWDRQMISDIFGFEYKWEAYTPISSRKFGHYVLPVLYGLEFIGRIEPKYNRAENTLEIKGFWMEPSCKWNREKSRAFWAYLEEFQKYLEAKSVVWFCNAPK